MAIVPLVEVTKYIYLKIPSTQKCAFSLVGEVNHLGIEILSEEAKVAR